MQHNNIIIANELDELSQKIIKLDKHKVSDSISEIHDVHREVEQIARKHGLTTLLAVVDWVDLSTELNDDNKQQIETLLTENAYSNWIDVVVSLLKDYNDNLRPVIHQSLTAPKWVVKPSTILLKDIATWIAAIKIEHLDNVPAFEESIVADDTKDSRDEEESSVVNNTSLETDTEVNKDTSSDTDANVANDETSSLYDADTSENIIEDQLKKAELASEEAMLHMNVFEEVDQDVLEKDYKASDQSEELASNEFSNNEEVVPLMETEKSSIDDEAFEMSNSNPSEMDIVENSELDELDLNITFEDNSLISELSKIHDALESVPTSSGDVFIFKDSFTKQLEKLALVAESTNLESIIPVVDWTQRNLLLFQDNSTSDIQKFVSTGKSWSWIGNVVKCLRTNNKNSCLNELTTALTHKEWLEPLDKDDLEGLLFGIDNVLNGDQIPSNKLDSEEKELVKTEFEELETDNSIVVPSSIVTNTLDPIDNNSDDALPELLDNPVVVNEINEGDKENDGEASDELETSGLQMTWDDDTHPELLMVYLEETPTQVEELLPLLDKISNETADTDDKSTAARLVHTIKGGSAVVGITALADYSSHLEELLEHSITSQLNADMLKKLPEIGKCVNDTFKAVQLQSNEPKEFLPTFKLLENYSYDLDAVISDVVKSMEAEDSTVLDNEVFNDSIELIKSEDTQEDSIYDLNDETETSTLTDNTDDSIETLIDDTEEVIERNVGQSELDECISEEGSTEIEATIDDIDVENNEIESIIQKSDETEETKSDMSGIASIASLAAASFVSKQIIDEVKSDETEVTEVTEVLEDKVEINIESISEDTEEIEDVDIQEISYSEKDTKEVEITSDDVIKEDITQRVTQEKSGFKMTWNDDTHPELLMVYLEETPTQINELVPLLNKISENNADEDEKHTASRMAHTIKGGSAIVGLTTLSEISYRLETLLDHSVKHQLPKDILETLPNAGTCIENLFEEIQMLGDEPEEYFGIYKKLDSYVNSIDDLDDEPLELTSVALPDFILNQNNSTEDKTESSSEETTNEFTSSVELKDDEVETEDTLAIPENEINEIEVESDANEVELNESDDEINETVEAKSDSSESESTIEDEKISTVIEIETEEENNEATVTDTNLAEEAETLELDAKETIADEDIKTENVIDEIEAKDSDIVKETETSEVEYEETIAESQETDLEKSSDVKESVEVESVKLDKLKTKEDVNNIIVEIDDIVMNLVSHSDSADNPAEFVEKCTVELERFELMTDLSGYPELSLLSQWCQSNLKSYTRRNKKFIRFIQSNEVWSWVEHVGECLRESDDMSHMSSLSVELMREDWLKAIKMEELQTVLLALRHLEDTGATEVVDEEQTKDINVNEVISWDKDVHPELLAVYFQETPDQIDQVAGLLHKISRGESSTEENKEAARIAHTIKGSSGVVGLNQLLELTHHLEDILDYSVNNEITPDTADLLSEASDCMESLFETIQNKQAPPDELPSVLKSLSTFSGNLSPADKASKEDSLKESLEDLQEEVVKVTSKTVITPSTTKAMPTEKSETSSVDTNEAFIRVPIKVIDRLLNLAGELVTTSNQVSDNLSKTQETNKTIRAQDERVIAMLEDLNKTIAQQEKDQQNLFSSMDNSDFDSLEMDTYNELNSVASLLSEGILDSQEIDNTLSRQLDELSERLHSLDKLNKTFSDVILSSRMVTIDTIVPRLERIVRQTCRKTNKKAQLVVKGNNLNVDTDILNNLVDPLLHMLRNSIDHGIEMPQQRIKNGKDETGLIELEFSRDGNNILMSLKDDGAGINPEKIYEKAIEKEIITPDQEFSDSDAIKLILQAGFSTQENVTDISGRGVGMDVVNTSIQDLNGTMGIDSKLGEGTSFNLTIPLTLITNTTLLVKVEDNLIAIPTDTIEQIMYQQADSMIKRDDEYFVVHNDVEIKTKPLGELLDWPHQLIDEEKSYNVLIIKTDDETYAIHVDGIESSREVVVKRLSPWVSPAKGVIGACHLNDGGVAPVINLVTVAKAAAAAEALGNNKSAPKRIIKANVKKKILVVDDSLSNRKALSLIIERTQFDVVTAVDGLDALRVMNENSIDLVFTDLEMPRMNGLELTQSIRAWNDKNKTPIVMITSRTTNKHRELAKKAGVDDYLTKPVETDILLQSIDTWLEAKEPMEV